MQLVLVRLTPMQSAGKADKCVCMVVVYFLFLIVMKLWFIAVVV